MSYIIGIIIGLLVSIILFLCETYLVSRGRGAVREIERATRTFITPKGEVLQPKSDAELELEEQLEAKIQRGDDLKAEDVL